MIGRRRNLLMLIGAALLVLLVVAWRMLFLPDALAFAGGRAYRLRNTRVPR